MTHLGFELDSNRISNPPPPKVVEVGGAHVRQKICDAFHLLKAISTLITGGHVALDHGATCGIYLSPRERMQLGPRYVAMIIRQRQHRYVPPSFSRIHQDRPL